MGNRHAQIEGGFTVRGEKRAALGGMPIDTHGHMERPVDLVRCSADRHHQPVRGCSRHHKAVGLRVGNHGLVVLNGWAEPVSEFRHAEELAVVRAGWVVQAAQQAGQISLVTQREHNRKVQPLRRRQLAKPLRLPAGDSREKMSLQCLLRLRRLCVKRNQQQSNRDEGSAGNPDVHNLTPLT